MAGPSPALCQPRAVQRNRGPNFPNSSTTAQLRISNINTQPASPASPRKECEDPAALGASLGVGPEPKVVCQNKSATPPSSPFLQGKPLACLSPAAIPPHLCRDESRQKCSGQPGYGRPGRWRRQCQSSRLCSPAFASAQNPRCPPQTAPEGRCQASPSTPCCYSTVGDGPSRPRPRRPSAFPHRRSLPLLQGA